MRRSRPWECRGHRGAVGSQSRTACHRPGRPGCSSRGTVGSRRRWGGAWRRGGGVVVGLGGSMLPSPSWSRGPGRGRAASRGRRAGLGTASHSPRPESARSLAMLGSLEGLVRSWCARQLADWCSDPRFAFWAVIRSDGRAIKDTDPPGKRSRMMPRVRVQRRKKQNRNDAGGVGKVGEIRRRVRIGTRRRW